VPGAPAPPSYVVAVLKRAAAAGGSSNDMAVYNDLFPAALREAASPQQLLEVLAAISAQVTVFATRQFRCLALCNVN
jgi:hypothetical protein